MAKKITLLQVVNGLAAGGGELKLLELLKNLGPQKYNIVIASVGQGGVLEQDFRQLGYPLFIFNKKHRFDVTLIWQLVKLIKRYKVDIVMTTLFYADVIGAIAAWLARVNAVISWEVFTAPQQRRHSLVYRIVQRNFTKVVSVSEAIARIVINERGVPAEKVVTIHYGVDTEKYKINHHLNKRAELGIGEKEIILGTVARLTEQKGHRYLIEAAPDIIAKFPNVRFVFVGGGPLEYELKRQIQDLGIKNYIIFLGVRKDVVELLNTFDVFVLPSLYEGLPNVVLEAMACGKPIVATSVDGTPEAVIHGETGYLVEPQNPTGLSEAVINLLNQPDQIILFGENSRRRAENYFSLNRQIKQFKNLFNNITLANSNCKK
ncbi:MAG: glycosyltransferase [bacterium]